MLLLSLDSPLFGTYDCLRRKIDRLLSDVEVRIGLCQSILCGNLQLFGFRNGGLQSFIIGLGCECRLSGRGDGNSRIEFCLCLCLWLSELIDFCFRFGFRFLLSDHFFIVFVDLCLEYVHSRIQNRFPLFGLLQLPLGTQIRR